jgi:hypothetical protein
MLIIRFTKIFSNHRFAQSFGGKKKFRNLRRIFRFDEIAPNKRLDTLESETVQKGIHLLWLEIEFGYRILKSSFAIFQSLELFRVVNEVRTTMINLALTR